ncbi:hypothetical protein [Streptomyces sp. enrichment culture]|uniref:hypothetical protein n=1 Tax=Streptomyces sp. enrichment culture TaxID=1795815 RepID=UPI003F544EEC
MRRRPSSTLSAAALVCLLVGGYTDSSPGPAPLPRETRSPASHGPSGPSADAAQPPELEVPDGAEVLVAETVGAGNRDLPDFTPADPAYTVYAGCTGPGEVTLVDRGGRGSSRRLACDGVPVVGIVHTGGSVHTRGEPQRLAMRVTGGASTWRVAVVSGEQPH